MVRMLSPGKRVAVFAGVVGFLLAALALTTFIPPVEGLGDKVRLPMFHGGSTWVNLGAFTLMGIAAFAYLVSGRRDLYRWSAAFRWVAAPMWLINTVLGVIAAVRTWDFTGSKSVPLVVIREDPRLMAQFVLLVLIVAVLLFDHIAETDGWRALGDLAYAATLWILMFVMVFENAEARALHPDNPVLNSAADIQIPFFAILGCLSVATLLAAWLVRDRMARTD